MIERTALWPLLLALCTLGFAPAGQAQGLPTFAVTAKDGRLEPAQIEVPAGQRIKLTVHNAGTSPIEFENLGLRVEKVLAPGARSFVVTPPLKPGVHEFIDEFHPDTGKMHLIAK
ncbi:cupredoxin domain-containing protein [Acidovorax sp. HDW3]|uniref:cupredoxin domain-containing protein n=1 Tax=Acidovorax sp. HDW3 TaxID=2714923 RepID=UPI0014085037|nr:cupredoxin domain-containing protein [Acidovorax sp. HDW3]QIL43570.1 cupredoxin domain-containing protein [Acidovorax sp. HDW3]